MATFSGLRMIIAGFAAVVCSMTFSVTAPAYFDSGGTATASSFDNPTIIVIRYSDYRPASEFILPMVKEQRVASDRPAFQPMAIKERASRSAVRPTAVSGWRSGRTCTLAA